MVGRRDFLTALRSAIAVFVLALAAYLVVVYVPDLRNHFLVQGTIWSLLSAVLCTLPKLGATYRKVLERQFGAWVGAGFGLVFALSK